MPNRTSLVALGRGTALAVFLAAALFAPTPAHATAPNDACAGAIDIAPNALPHTTAAVDLATVDPFSTATDPTWTCEPTVTGRRVWYSFTPAETAVYRVSSCASTVDTMIEIFDGAAGCGSAPVSMQACNDDQGASAFCTTTRSATHAVLQANQRYYIVVGAYSATTGNLAFTLEQLGQPVSNDFCAGALPLTLGTDGLALSPVVNNALATVTADPVPTCEDTNNQLGGSSGDGSRGVWFTFTPTVTQQYGIDTCLTEGLAASNSDTAISVFESTGGCSGTFTELTNACNSAGCGSHGSVGLTLTAGTTYYVLAFQGTYYPSNVTETNLRVRVYGPPANDVCTAAAPLQLALPVDGTIGVATNNHQLDGGATPYTGIGHTTSVTAAGRDVSYSFTAPSNGAYSFRLSPQADMSNPVIYVSDGNSCDPNTLLVNNILGAANRSSLSTTNETISCLPLTAGQSVYAHVDDTSTTAVGGTFEFEVFPCVNEAETTNGANNAPATAEAFTCGIAGAMNPAQDVDYFSLGTPATGSRVFALLDGNTGNNGFDLRVTDDTKTLEFDNSDNDTQWGANSGNVCGTPLAGAAAFLRVNYPSTTLTSEPYYLYSVVQPPSSSAVAETEPNDQRKIAGGGAGNYFSGALPANPDGGVSLDVDYYAFTGEPGDLIHVGLDGDPLRDNTPLNAKLELYDSAGVLLTAADDTSATSSITAATTLDAGTPFSPGEALVYKLRQRGTYYVAVVGQGTLTNGSGDYLLSIARQCAPGGGVVPPSSVSGISPTAGSSLGGTAVTVTGTGFIDGAQVRIGGALATTTFVGSNTLTAITPPGAAGNATVEVVHPGNQAVSLSGTFTYLPPPTVTTVSPPSGTTLGGTAFTITGTEFTGTVDVLFGSAAPASFTVVSPTQITGVTAAHAAATVDVTVANDQGAFTKTGAFTFLAPPKITSLSPSSGSTLGGNTITINGQDFVSGSVVKLDGATIAQSATGSATQLFITAPAHAAGAVSVQVVNPDSQQDTVASAYTFIAPPVLTSIDVTSGNSTGGTVVVLTGSNFDATAKVYFGTTLATNVSMSNGGTTLTATTPGGPAGAVDVVVENADGQRSTLTAQFTYITPYPAPTITGIAPDAGTTYGGTVVTLSGTDLRTGATVTFDGLAATAVSVDETAQTVTATTPAHGYGQVAVRVTNSDNQFGELAAGFEYIAPAPTLAASPIAPASGRTAGGLAVTITGDEFLPGATVELGGTPCASVTRVDKNTLTCTTPAHAAGFVTLTVTNPDGKSVSQANGFEFIAPPLFAAAGVAPNQGTTLGGTTVVITGQAFRAPATVEFGGVAATSVTVDSATQITAVTPARATAGAVSITITNADTQFLTVASAFTYYAPPSITSLSPTSGWAAGGQSLVINGAAFRTPVTVRFTVNGVTVNAPAVTVNSASKLTVTTPAHAPGLADVAVVNPDNQNATAAAAYTFVPAPSLTTVTPNHGPIAGGTRVVLSGQNIQSGATLTVGGTPAYAVSFTDPQTISGTTNGHAAGQADVVLTNPDGQTATLQGAFTYDGAPVLTSVSPARGPIAGGTAVTLTGQGFQSGATVKFGTTAATVGTVTATSITVTSPAHAAAVVAITVTNPDGQSSSLANAFNFVTPPALTGLTPAVGPTSGGTRVTLTGTDLPQGSTVTFGGVPALELTILGATSAEALAPPHAAGAVDVVLTGPSGATTTLQNAFTYESVAPQLSAVTPSSGTTAGGTTVTLTGQGFVPDAQVTIGGQPATGVVVVSASLIRAVTPAHSAGLVDVGVANPDGLGASLSGAFTYLTPSSPDEGRVTDGGTGGISVEEPADPPQPKPGCGCTAVDFPSIGLLSFAALALLRRRRK